MTTTNSVKKHLTRCQKQAIRQTIFESVIWTAGIATGGMVLILLVWGAVILGDHLLQVFPTLSIIGFIFHWGVMLILLGVALLLLISVIGVPMKHRYDEIKQYCEWKQKELKRGSDQK